MKHTLRFYTKNKLLKFLLFVLLNFLNISNAQINWQKLDGPLSPATPYSFLITSDGTQFVGTEGSNGIEEKNAGLFRSTNNGNTWELKNSGINSYIITYLAEAPNGNIYAGTRYGLMGGIIGCLYRSINNGESWELMINNDPDIYDIKFNALGYVLVGSQLGMFISTDNGNTWDLRNSGLSNYNVLSVLPISDSAIIVSTNDGIHFTTNNGLSWIARNNGLIKDAGYYRTNSLVFYNNILYVSSSNGLFYSTNYGMDWIQKASLIRTKNLQIDGSGFFYLIQDVEKRLLRSTDFGSTWDIIYNFTDFLSFFKIIENKIFTGVNTEGLFKSIDAGNSFIEYFSKPFGPLEISCFKWMSDSLLFAGTYGFGVYSTNDLGQSWKRLGPLKHDVTDLKVNKIEEIYANSYGTLYKSTNGGLNWSQIPSQLTQGIINITISKNNIVYTTHYGGYFSKLNEENHLDSIGCILSSDNPRSNSFMVDKFGDVYVSMFFRDMWGTSYYRTYQSQDSFKTFTTLFNYDNKLACDDSGFVYLGNTSMYMTKNRGSTFEPINNGLNNLKIYNISVIDNQEIYIGNISSLYLSTNQGEYWHSIPGPSSANGIHSIEKISSGLLLIASKNGIYRNLNPVSVDDFDVKQIISYSYSLNQNFPNPFNPTTKITWQSPVAGNQTLKVYDVLGNEVATLVNEFRNAGIYEIDFDASKLSSGVYFYQLKVGDIVSTKKMILVK